MSVPVTSKKLKVLSLAAVIFLTVSGGPYGLEPLLDYVGGKYGLIMLLVTPVLWDIPTILTVMELNSMMPETGGYYQWVKKAIGLKWAFFEGWWTWLYTFVDLGIYPQLFITYTAIFFPQIVAYKLIISLCIIWGGALLNILGIVPIGRVSVILTGIVLVPFLILFTHAFGHAPAVVIPAATHPPYFGMALFIIMWNFIGWDNVTTYANEVNKPGKSYIKAICLAFVCIVALYFGTMYMANRSGIAPAVLRDSGFPALGTLVGGSWLGVTIAVGGMISSLGLFTAVLLSVSRIPKAMADDKLLPSVLIKLHPKFNTPHFSIILCAVVVSCLTWLTFCELLIIDISIYFSGLFLEFVSLIVLRIKHPQMDRPFRIPLGTVGLCLILLLPTAVFLAALIHVVMHTPEGVKPLCIALGMMLSAFVAWYIIVLYKRYTQQEDKQIQP